MRNVQQWLWLLLALGVVCVPVYALIHLGRELHAETYAEKPFDHAVARRVVAAVRQGSLKPDAFGVADLLPALAAATGQGAITVTHAKKSLVLVFFPTRHERFRARGYLYCSRPLTPADTTRT